MLAATVAVAVAATTSVAGSGVDRAATGGDPYTMTPEHLRAELARTGLDIRYASPGGRSLPAITGVAARDGGSVGFEFQLYPTSDQATIRNLGHLGLRDLGWRGSRHSVYFAKAIRGVLANVAYAQYEIEPRSASRTVQTHLRSDGIRRAIRRALDDALFRAFPEDDPYAHALEAAPNSR